MARNRMGRMFDQGYLLVRTELHAFNSWLSARKRLKLLNGGYKGTREEFQKVIEYWKPYGVKPKKLWYRMYCDGRGSFDPKYIPDSIWKSKILPYYNNLLWGNAYADKCSYDWIFPDLRKPRTVVKNSCGRYYDGNQNIITKEEAIQICQKEKEFIIKAATYSYGGESIKVFKEGEFDKETIRQLFEQYRMNFVVQELVEQNAYLANLNPTSLNTLRVISFFFKGEVYILSGQLRIGGRGARVDNYSSGGFACNVNLDGRVSERAVSKESGWATVHPNGYAFNEIVVPSYDKVLNAIKREHVKFAHLNIIGWDFAVDENGEAVFIEMNVRPGQNQNGSGPTFGDLTEEVLQDVFIDKTLRDAFI